MNDATSTMLPPAISQVDSSLLIANQLLQDSDFQIQLSQLNLKTDPVEIISLNNGVTIYFLNRLEKISNGSFASFQAIVKTGFVSEHYSKYSTQDLQQIAHFIEHCVFLGTETYSRENIQTFLKEIGCPPGADSNASTGLEFTTFSLNNVSTSNEDHLKKAIHMLYEFVFCAAFPPCIMEEKIPVEHEMLAKRGALFESIAHLYKNVFPEMPPSKVDYLPLSENIFKKLDYKNLRELILNFYKEQYSPTNTTFICVGDFGENATQILDSIKSIFSQARKPFPNELIHSPYTEKLPDFKYGISAFTHSEMIESCITIHQRYLIEKEPEIKHIPRRNIHLLKEEFLLSKNLRSVLESLIMRIHQTILRFNIASFFIQGLQCISWDPYRKTNSWCYERKITFQVIQDNPYEAFFSGLQALYNLEGEITEQTLSIAKKTFQKDLHNSSLQLKEADHQMFANIYFSFLQNPSILLEKESEIRLKSFLAKVITVDHLKHYLRQNIAFFNPSKKSVIHLHATSSKKFPICINTISQKFLDFFESKKKPLISTLKLNENIFKGFRFEPKDWNNKISFANGIYEYTFQNGAKVILYPSKKSEEKKVYASIKFDSWSYVVDSTKRNDFAIKSYYLQQLLSLNLNGCSFSQISQEYENHNILFDQNITPDYWELSYLLQDVNNLGGLFNFMYLYAQAPHYWDLESLKALFEAELHQKQIEKKLQQNTESSIYFDHKLERLYEKSPFVMNLDKLDYSSDISFSAFKEQLPLFFEKAPAPTITISGYFDLEEMESLLKTHIGNMEFPRKGIRKDIPQAVFPEGVRESDFEIQGVENRTQTTIAFPLPSITDAKSYHILNNIASLLQQFFQDHMRHKGKQFVYSVEVKSRMTSSQTPWEIPNLGFYLNYATDNHQEILDLFWETVNAYKKQSQEEKAAHINLAICKAQKDLDHDSSRIDFLHENLLLHSIYQFPLENTFENYKTEDFLIPESVHLAEKVLKKENFIRVTMHTK